MILPAPLILASSSPQRKQLLEGLNLPFTICVSTIDEEAHSEKDPLQRSMNLARLKAEDVARVHAGSIVIGCDTLVVAETGELLEKPIDADDARRMLRLHSGKTCVVHSALCIIDHRGTIHEAVSTSSVRFTSMTQEQEDWWIQTDLWKGRSGGFQIDGPGQLLIEHIDGDWTSIVGFPVYEFGRLMRGIQE